MKGLSLKQLEVLSRLSGVPYHTLYKIKRGETDNPGIETLRKFVPHIGAASQPAPQAQGE